MKKPIKPSRGYPFGLLAVPFTLLNKDKPCVSAKPDTAGTPGVSALQPRPVQHES
jgi:hypothetical protein